jgi:hypothetical protein
MMPPLQLYRYRPLTDDLFDRELDALEKSYLFAPPFAFMNDPMEAFYETGGPGDRLLGLVLNDAERQLQKMYGLLKATIDNFALVSFSSSYDDLPLWAYYGSNFAGMCLEFETDQLAIGDFQNEQLRQVTYAQSALPALTMADLGPQNTEAAVLSRITRKRTEWAHEKEWRYVTGQVGPKQYLDDALRRVFLGPRVKADHAERICKVLAKRPVEILQGVIKGFELTFETLQPACPLADCERVGEGRFDQDTDLWAKDDLEKFLRVPLKTLVDECVATALRPNTAMVSDVDISSKTPRAIYIWSIHKMRNGREIYHKRYYDANFQMMTQP